MYKELLGARKTLLEFAKEHDVSVEEIDTTEIEQCSDCSVWAYKNDLSLDKWNNLLCQTCEECYEL